MKKIFFLLIIITYHALFSTTNPLHASCNQSTEPNVFKIHGTKDEKVVIEGECLNELLKAMGEGKDIDIKYAEIKGGIDFTDTEFFPAYSFDEAKEKKLLSPNEIAHINRVNIPFGDPNIVLVKGAINITDSIIDGNITTYPYPYFYSEVSYILIFEERVNFYNTQFNKNANFEDAQFDREATFWDAQFVGRTSFSSASFAGEAIFLAARFDREAFFGSAQFAGKAEFSGAQFDRGAFFGSAQFAGRASFGGAKFADCSFNSALFGIISAYTATYLKTGNILKILAKDTNKDAKDIESLEIFGSNGKYFIGSKQLSPRTIKLIYAYRAAIYEENPGYITGKSAKDVLPKKEIVAYSNTTSNFSNAIFAEFADFRNALFLGDVDFKEATFKDVGLFDGCLFFNAEELGLVEENNEDSLVDLNIDDAYFNMLRGVSFDQVFPHLHKRVKFNKVKDGHEMQRSKDNYIYLQENFRTRGRFEDADSIYLERRRIEAKNLTGWRNWWKMMWNWILEVTCNYGTNFTHIFISCGSLIAIFTVLYFLTVIPCVQKRFGNIKIHDDEHDKIKWPNRLWHSFYISVNSFTTLGTGDITITRYFRALVIMEGALGWFMLGLFIVVFAAQFMR